MIGGFEEVELSRDYTDVARGGPVFETAITGNSKAIQQRVISRFDAARVYSIEFGGMKLQERNDLEEFFITKFGRAVGFRFYPPSDRNFQNDVIGVGNGTQNVFYMRRNYASVSRFVSRRIIKPIRNKVTVTIDGAKVTANGVTPTGSYPLSGNTATIDWNEGRIQFASAPAVDQIIRCAEGEYNLPVNFETDRFGAVDYSTFSNLESVSVVEILPAALSSVTDDIPQGSLAITTPVDRTVTGGSVSVTASGAGTIAAYLFINGESKGKRTTLPYSWGGAAVTPTTDNRVVIQVVGVTAGGLIIEAKVNAFYL